MSKMRLMFYLTVVDFISDWYSIHKVTRTHDTRVMSSFSMINKLRGNIRDKLEEIENDESIRN